MIAQFQTLDESLVSFLESKGLRVMRPILPNKIYENFLWVDPFPSDLRGELQATFGTGPTQILFLESSNDSSIDVPTPIYLANFPDHSESDICEFMSSFGPVDAVTWHNGKIDLEVLFERTSSCLLALKLLPQLKIPNTKAPISSSFSEEELGIIEVKGLPSDFLQTDWIKFHIPEPITVTRSDDTSYAKFADTEKAKEAIQHMRHAIIAGQTVKARLVVGLVKKHELQKNKMIIRNLRPGTRAFDVEAWTIENVCQKDEIYNVQLLSDSLPSAVVTFWDRKTRNEAQEKVQKLNTKLQFEF